MASLEGINVLVFGMNPCSTITGLVQLIQSVFVDGESIEDAGVLASLDTFEEMTNRYSYDKDPDVDPGTARPCQYFDLIMGSGHGGFLALMFGRLGMQVSNVKKAYEEFHSSIHLAQADPEERGNDFDFFLQKLLHEELGTDDPSELLLIPGTSAPTASCRTAILASTPDNLTLPTTFRTYGVRANRTANCTILQATRASTASTGRFPAVVINGETFVSASSIGHRCPVEMALIEANTAFPGKPLRCVVSIGSGHPGHISHVRDDKVSAEQALIHLASYSILPSHLVAARLAREGQYFRFDVEQGLQLHSCGTGTIAGRVRTHTRRYLEMVETGKRLEEAIQLLRWAHPIQPMKSKQPEEPAPLTEVPHITSVPPIETYMYELYEEGHGLPLWNPELQDGSKLVEIGDVGIVTEDGGFEILFNTTFLEDRDSDHAYSLPEGFERFSFSPSDIKTTKTDFTSPYVMHGNLTLHHHGFDEAGDGDEVLPTCPRDFCLSFTVTDGAALVLKDQPIKKFLLSSSKIHKYIQRNCKSWYKFYVDDPEGPQRILGKSPLIFVTGIVQNSKWALAAWENLPSAVQVTYSGHAIVREESVEIIRGRWKPSLMHNLKQGPVGSSTPACQSVPNDIVPSKASQTLFIRGYTIKKNTKHPKKTQPSHLYQRSSRSQSNRLKNFKIRAAAEPQGLPFLPPPSPPPMMLNILDENESDNLEIEELFSLPMPRHPVEDVIDLLFEIVPESSFGIVHDDEALMFMHHLNKSSSACPVDISYKEGALRLEPVNQSSNNLSEIPRTRPLPALTRSGEDKIAAATLHPKPLLVMDYLGRIIIAYLHSDTTALCCLSRVNHALYLLSAPFLYQTVTVRSPKALHRFLLTMSTRSHFRKHLQELRIDNVLPNSLHALADCPNFVSLSITLDLGSQTPELSLPSSVTMLSANPAYFITGFPTPTHHDALRNLTHFHTMRGLANDHIWLWLQQANLSALRYLVVHSSDSGNIQTIIQESIPELKHLPSNENLYVLLWFSARAVYEKFEPLTKETRDLVNGTVDPRVVVVAHTANWPESIRRRIMNPVELGENGSLKLSGGLWKRVEEAMKHGVPLGRIILQIGNTEGKECQICYDTSARKEKCSLDSCQHILCRPCLAQYILTKVEEKQVPIWCPVCWAEDRPNLLAFEADALQTLGFQQSDIDAFITLTMQSISLPLTCPECAHEFSVDREDFSGLTTIGCPLPTCKHIWCKFCRQEIPFGYVGEHTCDGSSELKALMTEKGWKFCPACRAPHEKVSGCNHIICTAQGCSAHYCFKCGKLMTTSKNRQEIANAIQQHANSC